MFDTVRCECPLPAGAEGADGWQTKTLACGMQTYVLSASGALVRLVEVGQAQYDEFGLRPPAPT